MEQGPSISNFDKLIINDSLQKLVPMNVDYSAAAFDLSKTLEKEIGVEHWNVILAGGVIGKKTFASGGHYCKMRREDGVIAIIWLTKLVRFETFRTKTEAGIQWQRPLISDRGT